MAPWQPVQVTSYGQDPVTTLFYVEVPTFANPPIGVGSTLQIRGFKMNNRVYKSPNGAWQVDSITPGAQAGQSNYYLRGTQGVATTQIFTKGTVHYAAKPVDVKLLAAIQTGNGKTIMDQIRQVQITQLTGNLGIATLFLHGGVAARHREELVSSFQAGDAPVFLLSLKAGGVALDVKDADALTRANRELLTLHELIAHRLVQILLGVHRGRAFSTK